VRSVPQPRCTRMRSGSRLDLLLLPGLIFVAM
jgi:hypothetical protein